MRVSPCGGLPCGLRGKNYTAIKNGHAHGSMDFLRALWVLAIAVIVIERQLESRRC